MARYAILAVCLAMAGIGAVLTHHHHVLDPQSRMLAVIFWELMGLLAVGASAFLAELFSKRHARIASGLFFGVLAGVMGLNFLSDALAGVKFDTNIGYLMNYGLELLFLALSLAGLFLSLMTSTVAMAEPGAPPKGGSGKSPCKSRALDGPTSVT